MPRRRKRSSEHAALRRKAHKDGTYDRLLQEQGGGCALCGKPPTNRKHHVDHCHRSMVIRGVLCFRCNANLRYWMSPGWLRAAAEYLEAAKPREEP